MEHAATAIQTAWKAHTFTCDDCGKTKLNREAYGNGCCYDCMSEYHRQYYEAKEMAEEMWRMYAERVCTRADKPKCDACDGKTWWGWLKREDLCEECSEELSEWMSKFEGKCRCGEDLYACHETCRHDHEEDDHHFGFVPCCMCGNDCSDGDYVGWKICSRECLTRDSRW